MHLSKVNPFGGKDEQSEPRNKTCTVNNNAAVCHPMHLRGHTHQSKDMMKCNLRSNLGFVVILTNLKTVMLYKKN